MTKRKGISKKTRFEVFKRDAFTCQYCGRTAPDCVLEVDHIVPVAKGGDNEMINLVTSCFDCNRGKSDREISDTSAVKIQQEQIKKIAEKREQLEMIAKWRTELLHIADQELTIACDHFEALNGRYSISESSKVEVKKLIKKYGLEEVMTSMEIAFDLYGSETEQSIQLAYEKIGGICYNRKMQRENPAVKHRQRAFYYINKRFNYVNQTVLKKILNDFVDTEEDALEVIDAAKECRNWTEFRERW